MAKISIPQAIEACMLSCVFTGIIEATAPVIEKSDSTLKVERPPQFDDIRIGSSICVSGVCLSVIAFDEQSMTFDVMGETWEKSKLGSLKAGDQVNLERAMKADGRFEGHVVQGHVEATGRVERGMLKEESAISIGVPQNLLKYIVPKGSITLDGVSLTVVSIDQNICTVALIPHTVENTTLGSLSEGNLVNIETDVMGRYITNS